MKTKPADSKAEIEMQRSLGAAIYGNEPRRMRPVAAKRHSAQLLTEGIENGKSALGKGWNHVSTELRAGLVFAYVTRVLANQDDSISADRTVTTLREVADLITQWENEQ